MNFMQGTLDVLILTALADRPLHGYDVVEWIRTTTDGALRIDDGALYTSLHPNAYVQSLSLLALYASGAEIELSDEDFLLLDQNVEEYASIMASAKYTHTKNRMFAQFVRRHAVIRAQRDGIFPEPEAIR